MLILALPSSPPQVDRLQIMNWSIDHVNNHVDATTLEDNTASRTLNKFTLYIMVSRRHTLSRLSPAALLDWRSSN